MLGYLASGKALHNNNIVHASSVVVFGNMWVKTCVTLFDYRLYSKYGGIK